MYSNEKGKDLSAGQSIHCSACGSLIRTTSYKPSNSDNQIKCSKCEQKREFSPKKRFYPKNIHENQMNSVRVVQNNLVYVVGIPTEYANVNTLLSYEFFGQYGPITKIVVNPSKYLSSDNKTFTHSAYVTFSNEEDALECIYSLENFVLNGSQIKASFGTSKYCSSFLEGKKCPNPDCMFLHEYGNNNDSFSTNEIQTSSTRFLASTRPSRPPDYSKYTMQDAVKTMLPPRRLLFRDKEPICNSENWYEKLINNQHLLHDDFDEKMEGRSPLSSIGFGHLSPRPFYNALKKERNDGSIHSYPL